MSKMQIFQDCWDSRSAMNYDELEVGEIRAKILQEINDAHRVHCKDFFGMDCVSLATKSTDTKSVGFNYNFALDYGIT